jgi:hypothetical protein
MCNCRDANHPAFGGFTPNFQWEVGAVAGLFLIFDRKDALKTNESFVTFKWFNDFNKQISGLSFQVMKKYYMCCSTWQLRKRSGKYNQRFIEEHKQLFSCFMTSRKGETYAYCKICCLEIAVSHGGKGDLPKHVKSNKHSKLSELSETNRKITNSLTPVKGLSVVKSEGFFNQFLIQYNIPLM